MDRKKMFQAGILGSFILLAGVHLPAGAEIRLPRLFSDNLVLQCGAKVPVWGWADPGEKVVVQFRAQRVETTADANGKWSLSLAPVEIGGPYELTVAGKNSLVIKNVLAGEVWLCSGQSNMAMTVGSCLNADQETAGADYPEIRYFQVKAAKSLEPLADVSATADPELQWLNRWLVTSPATVGNFSGVGYFFAKQIHARLGVPVGLINSSWGGTVAEAWTSRQTLETDPELKPILTNWPDYNNDEGWLKEQYQKFTAEVEKAKQESRTPPLYFNQPTVLFNSMIMPLVPYAIRGALWYQGESNAFRAYQYRRLFPALIRNWRNVWHAGDFPFLFVQLANFESGSGAWPELREAQSMALALSRTGMAVTTDIGEAQDVHPKNKQEVGRRLSLAARALVYGEKIEYSGPLYQSVTVEGGKAYLSFSHTGDGLAAGGGAPLGGFAVAGEDKIFVPATAEIRGERLAVWSAEVAAPVAVRYAWADNPEGANLYNKTGAEIYLPAASFRTDDWPGLTVGRK